MNATTIQQVAAWITLFIAVPYLCLSVRRKKQDNDDDFDPDGMGTT